MYFSRQKLRVYFQIRHDCVFIFIAKNDGGNKRSKSENTADWNNEDRSG